MDDWHQRFCFFHCRAGKLCLMLCVCDRREFPLPMDAAAPQLGTSAGRRIICIAGRPADPGSRFPRLLFHDVL